MKTHEAVIAAKQELKAALAARKALPEPELEFHAVEASCGMDCCGMVSAVTAKATTERGKAHESCLRARASYLAALYYWQLKCKQLRAAEWTQKQYYKTIENIEHRGYSTKGIL